MSYSEWSFNQRTFDFTLRLDAMGTAHIPRILWPPNNPAIPSSNRQPNGYPLRLISGM